VRGLLKLQQHCKYGGRSQGGATGQTTSGDGELDGNVAPGEVAGELDDDGIEEEGIKDEGTGECDCGSGFNSTDYCASCLPGYYGPSCAACSISCNGHGNCSDGIQGTGICICIDNTLYDPNNNCKLYGSSHQSHSGPSNLSYIYATVSVAAVLFVFLGSFIIYKQRKNKQELEFVIATTIGAAPAEFGLTTSGLNHMQSSNSFSSKTSVDNSNNIIYTAGFTEKEMKPSEFEVIGQNNKRNIIMEEERNL